MTRCLCVQRHSPEPSPAAEERHHIFPKQYGGNDAPTNLVWLCATAHNLVHVRIRTNRGGNTYHRELAKRATDAILGSRGYKASRTEKVRVT